MSNVTPVVKEIRKQIGQLMHHSLWNGTHKRSKFHNQKRFTFIAMNDTTLRCAKGNTNVDIEYIAGRELYKVTVHKIKKMSEVSTTTTEDVYFDSLLEFF